MSLFVYFEHSVCSVLESFICRILIPFLQRNLKQLTRSSLNIVCRFVNYLPALLVRVMNNFAGQACGAKILHVEMHFPLSAIKKQRYGFNLEAKIKALRSEPRKKDRFFLFFFFFCFFLFYRRISRLLMEKQRSIFRAEGATLKYSICQLRWSIRSRPFLLRLSFFLPSPH